MLTFPFGLGSTLADVEEEECASPLVEEEEDLNGFWKCILE